MLGLHSNSIQTERVNIDINLYLKINPSNQQETYETNHKEKPHLHKKKNKLSCQRLLPQTQWYFPSAHQVASELILYF